MDRITHLWQQYISGKAVPEEVDELFALLETDESRRVSLDYLMDYRHQVAEDPTFDTARQMAMLEKILPPAPAPVRRIGWQRITGYAAAAAVFLGIAFAGYRYFRTSAPVAIPVAMVAEIRGGMPGAVLTLADGRQVQLDRLHIDTVLHQPGTVATLKEGQLSYAKTGDTQADVSWNTMQTPRGKQFQLLLPDGSAAWLNAESSVRFPTSFQGNQRVVEVTGEVYFEIAKDAAHPFIVNIRKAASVEVLGTSFNVEAYPEQAAITTTLVTGAVKVTKGNGHTLLKPGEQVKVTATGLQQPAMADMEQAMAWKNGLFDFNGASLKEVMQQVSRWYDIEVVYEHGIPDITFGGQLRRDMSLAELIRFLQLSEVHFRLETPHKLVILPS